MTSLLIGCSVLCGVVDLFVTIKGGAAPVFIRLNLNGRLEFLDRSFQLWNVLVLCADWCRDVVGCVVRFFRVHYVRCLWFRWFTSCNAVVTITKG